MVKVNYFQRRHKDLSFFGKGNNLDILKKIGQQLDKDIFPCVVNGGIVMPSEATVSTLTWAKEQEDEKSRTRRPEAGSWTRTPRWQRTPDRDRASDHTASLISPDLKAKYERELMEVQEAYPHARVWLQEEGLWLLIESSLLPGLWQKAVFLIGIPFVRTLTVRAWGFWLGIPFTYPIWIGPRHTNYPDGSVCAFEPNDGTWRIGDPIIPLLDIYTLWALRHLHLQTFDRWPGRQVVHHPYERLIELKGNDYCGCGSHRFYGECCRPSDLDKNLISSAAEFARRTGGGERKPPAAVLAFIREKAEAPFVLDLLR